MERITLLLSLKPDQKPAIKTGDKKPAIKTGGKITAYRKELILQYLTAHAAASAAELAEMLGLKASRVREILAQMQTENLIAAEGGNRNRIYKLKR